MMTGGFVVNAKTYLGRVGAQRINTNRWMTGPDDATATCLELVKQISEQVQRDGLD